MLSHSKICWIWRTCFYIDECATVRTVALRGAFLKKGLATFILGLIYHSMALSQLQSRDTVHLNERQFESHLGLEKLAPLLDLTYCIYLLHSRGSFPPELYVVMFSGNELRK
jgi:hypothetical protein